MKWLKNLRERKGEQRNLDLFDRAKAMDVVDPPDLSICKSILQKSIRVGISAENSAVGAALACLDRGEGQSIALRLCVITIEDVFDFQLVPETITVMKKIIEIIKKQKSELMPVARVMMGTQVRKLCRSNKNKDAGFVFNIARQKYGEVIQFDDDWRIKFINALDESNEIEACRYALPVLEKFENQGYRDLMEIIEDKSCEREPVSSACIQAIRYRLSQNARSVDKELMIGAAICFLCRTSKIKFEDYNWDGKATLASIDSHCAPGRFAHNIYCRKNNYDNTKLSYVRFFCEGGKVNQISEESRYQETALEYFAKVQGFQSYKVMKEEWEKILSGSNGLHELVRWACKKHNVKVR